MRKFICPHLLTKTINLGMDDPKLFEADPKPMKKRIFGGGKKGDLNSYFNLNSEYSEGESEKGSNENVFPFINDYNSTFKREYPNDVGMSSKEALQFDQRTKDEGINMRNETNAMDNLIEPNQIKLKHVQSLDDVKFPVYKHSGVKIREKMVDFVALMPSVRSTMRVIADLKLQRETELSVDLDQFISVVPSQLNSVHTDEFIPNVENISLNAINPPEEIPVASKINTQNAINISNVNPIDLKPNIHNLPRVNVSKDTRIVSLIPAVRKVMWFINEIKLDAHEDIDITSIYQDISVNLVPTNGVDLSPTLRSLPNVSVKKADELKIDTDSHVAPNIEFKNKSDLDLKLDTYKLSQPTFLRNAEDDATRVSLLSDVLNVLNIVTRLRLNQHDSINAQVQLHNIENADIKLNATDSVDLSIQSGRIPLPELNNKVFEPEKELSNLDLFWPSKHPEVELNDATAFDLKRSIPQTINLAKPPNVSVRRDFTRTLDLITQIALNPVKSIEIEELLNFSVRNLNNVTPLMLRNPIENQRVNISDERNIISLRPNVVQLMRFLPNMKIINTTAIDVSELAYNAIEGINNVIPLNVSRNIQNEHSIELDKQQVGLKSDVKRVLELARNIRIQVPKVRIMHQIQDTLDVISQINLVNASEIDLYPFTNVATQSLNNVTGLNTYNTINQQRISINHGAAHVNILNDVRKVMDVIRNTRLAHTSEIDMSYYSNNNNDVNLLNTERLRLANEIQKQRMQLGSFMVSLRNEVRSTMQTILKMMGVTPPQPLSGNLQPPTPYPPFNPNQPYPPPPQYTYPQPPQYPYAQPPQYPYAQPPQYTYPPPQQPQPQTQPLRLYFEADETGKVSHKSNVTDEASFFGGYTLENIPQSMRTFSSSNEDTFVKNIHYIVNEIRNPNANNTVFKFSCEPTSASNPMNHELKQLFFKRIQ